MKERGERWGKEGGLGKRRSERGRGGGKGEGTNKGGGKEGRLR